MRKSKLKMWRAISLSLCLFFGLPICAETVKGLVLDATTQEPIIGANVIIKSRPTVGGVTDLNGWFSIEANRGEAIQISYIGYQTAIVEAGTEAVTVKLEELITGLDEVVVVGYGSIEKKKLTSAISSVKSDDFLAGSIKDAGQLIQGKVAGLNISMPNGDPTGDVEIVLRGTNSLKSGSTPLILIDGVPGDLKLVAPDNIESIDVLKDGSAAAIYGTRANNGVILVTTKTAKAGQTSISYNGYVSTEEISRTPEVLTASKYRELLNDGSGYVEENSDYGYSTDWLDEITRTPVSHYHSVSLTWGDETTNVYANVTAKESQGVFLNSDKSDFSGKLSLNHTAFDGLLKININTIINKQDYTTTVDGDNSFNSYAYNQALTANPTAPVVMPDGSWCQPKFLGIDIATWENPVALLRERKGNNDNFTGRVYGNVLLTPMRGLKFNLLMSYQRYNQTRGYSQSSRDISNTVYASTPLFASMASTQTEDALLELTGQFDKSIGDNNLSVLGGYSYTRNEWIHFWMNNYGFPSDQLTYYNMGLGSALTEGKAGMYSNKTSGNLVGFFGRVNYSYAEKYMLTASLRYEGDSKFIGSDEEWGMFPAVSAAWRINKERFMDDMTFIDDLKLRAGYGITGIAPSAYYQTVSRLKYSSTGNSFYYGGEWVTPLSPANNVNTKFTWEKKHEYNVGLDFSLFRGKLSGSIDYYNRLTSDLLWDFSVPVPPNVYGTTTANIGKIRNKGIEVMLSGSAVDNRDFKWTPTVTFSYNTNKLTSLDFEQYGVEEPRDYFFTNAEEGSYSCTHRIKVGEPIGQIWGYKVVGITEEGKWMFDDPTNPGNTFTTDDSGITIETHGQVLGNSLPKYYVGFNNTFVYKNFDLNVMMRGAFDYDIINQYRLRNENVSNRRSNNKPVSAFEKVYGISVNQNPVEKITSYYVENGDFWKIDNITLGYTLKTPKLKYLNSLRIYATVNNAFIFTGYDGNDPESASRTGLNPGMDYMNQYPTTRVYTLGLNLNF